jgi:hypothetical protein
MSSISGKNDDKYKNKLKNMILNNKTKLINNIKKCYIPDEYDKYKIRKCFIDEIEYIRSFEINDNIIYYWKNKDICYRMVVNNNNVKNIFDNMNIFTIYDLDYYIKMDNNNYISNRLFYK